MPVEQTMTRTERRRIATHNDLLQATRDLLVERGQRDMSARLIARRADHAAATFYNHFSEVDAAIDEAVGPVRLRAAEWARRIIEADDFHLAVSTFVAEFLVEIESDGRDWQVLYASNRRALDEETFQEIGERMRARHGEHFDGRGVPAGEAGPVVLHLMSVCGDLYGGRVLGEGVRRRVARLLLSVHWVDRATINRQVEVTLGLVEQLRGARS